MIVCLALLEQIWQQVRKSVKYARVGTQLGYMWGCGLFDENLRWSEIAKEKKKSMRFSF